MGAGCRDSRGLWPSGYEGRDIPRQNPGICTGVLVLDGGESRAKDGKHLSATLLEALSTGGIRGRLASERPIVNGRQGPLLPPMVKASHI